MEGDLPESKEGETGVPNSYANFKYLKKFKIIFYMKMSFLEV